MAKVTICDGCGQPTNNIVLKLFATTLNGAKSRHDHGAYSKHADIGECCADRFTRAIRWQPRRPKVKK